MSFSIEKKDQSFIKHPNNTNEAQTKRKAVRFGSIGLALLPLAACGGGGSGQSPTNVTPPPPPPPPPEPDFIEDPANFFTARDDNNRTLNEGSATADLTVLGKGGNDSISTGSGADKIRGGEGADTIVAGAGDDVIVVVGTTTAAQYNDASITNPGGSGLDLSSLITLADLNGRTVSEVVSGESIDGGTGNNTLYIYGTVDLTGVTLTNVTQLIVNSDVSLTQEQIAQFTTIDGDGSSVVRIVVPEGSDEVVLDLSSIDVSDLGSIQIEGDLTIRVSGLDDVEGITEIISASGSGLKLHIDNGDVPTDISLLALAGVFSKVDIIDLGSNATLVIDAPEQIAELGLSQLSGAGEVDVNGSAEAVEALGNVEISETINSMPTVNSPAFEFTEGGTTVLGRNDFAISDVDDADAAIMIQISNITHGQFEKGNVAVVSFTLQDVADGLISFVHDGGENAPAFDIAVKDDELGAVYSAPVSAGIIYTAVNDAPVIGAPAFAFSEGGTTVLGRNDFAISDVDDADAALMIQVSNITHGQFEKDNVAVVAFTLQDVSDGLISFVHDGSENAPAFDVSVKDDEAFAEYSLPVASEITFSNVNDAPEIGLPSFEVKNGQKVILTRDGFDITDIDDSDANIFIRVSAVTHGLFEKDNVVVTEFTLQDVVNGLISFAHDGSASAPSFDISVRDDEAGSDYGLPVSADVSLAVFKFLSLSSNEIERGTDGIEFNFEVEGNSVMITVEVVDSNGTTRLYSYDGVSGTVVLPMEGIDHRYQSTSQFYLIDTYEITQIYFEDSLGKVTYLNADQLASFGMDTSINILPNSNNDISPPELINFEILSDPANLDVYGRPTIHIEANDAESGINLFHIYAINDSGVEVLIYWGKNDSATSSLEVSKWVSSHYSISRMIVINDAVDGPQLFTTYTAEQLQQMGFVTEFDVTATREYPEEFRSANLTQFSIADSTIDLSISQSIEIQFDTGKPYARGVNIWLTDENGQTLLFNTFGDAGSGTISLKLSASVTAGTYHITKVQVLNLWETVTYNQDELNDLGFSTTVELVGEMGIIDRDTTAPEIISLEIMDSVINMDEGEFYIPIRSEIYDESDIPITYARYVTSDGHYLMVSIQENVTGGHALSLDQEPGVYNLQDVVTQDIEGNTATYFGSNLDQFTLPPSIEIINSFSDTQPADVTHFNFIDDYIDMQAGENQVLIEYSITDDFSGAGSMVISLRGPNDEKYHLNVYDDEGVISLTLPNDAPSGIYTVYQLIVRDETDSLYNIKRYLSYDEDYSMYEFDDPIEYLQDLGFETSFEVFNDNSEPLLNLTMFTLSQSSVTLGDDQAQQVIEFSTSASKGMIDGMMVKFVDANGVLHSNYVNGSSGTTQLSFDITTAVSGNYSLHSVTLYDHQGNARSYNADEIQAGFGNSAISFTITNPSYSELIISDTTPYTFLPAEAISPTGDPLIDGLLEGVRYSMPSDGSPLIITYSFVDPDRSVFDQNAGYGAANVQYEDANLLAALTGDQQATVREILNEIESYTNIIFVEVEDNGESSAGHFRFSWTGGWLDTGIIDNSAAWASPPVNTAKAGDVWLSLNKLSNNVEKDEVGYLFDHILVHEIGHALGLNHPFEGTASFGHLPLEYDGNDFTAMSYNRIAGSEIESGHSAPEHFMWLDIQALQYLYGSNAAISAGDDTYQFLPNERNYMTIWDSGGIDTFDVSLNDAGVSIDLNSGSWSDVGTEVHYRVVDSMIKEDTIYIAPDTVIENVITGDGDDTIYGNDQDNIIQTNGGNDHIYSSSGIDIIDGGEGEDTYILVGSQIDLNLVDLTMNNMEIIDLTGSGDNSLSFTLDDILVMTDVGNHIVIKGDTGDTVTSTAQGWVQGEDETIEGEVYHVYTSGDGTLLIDTDISQGIS